MLKYMHHGHYLLISSSSASPFVDMYEFLRSVDENRVLLLIYHRFIPSEVFPSFFFFLSSIRRAHCHYCETPSLSLSLSSSLSMPGLFKKRTLLPLLPLNSCTEWIKGRNPSSPPLFPLPQPISLRARIIYVGFDSCIWIHWLCIAILITPFFSSLFLLRSRRYSVFNVLAPIDESSMLTRSFVL